jgi:signal recognition particle receptor subunit beta
MVRNTTEIDKDEAEGLMDLLQHDREVIDSRIKILKKGMFDVGTVDDLNEIYGDLENVIDGIKQIIE